MMNSVPAPTKTLVFMLINRCTRSREKPIFLLIVSTYRLLGTSPLREGNHKSALEPCGRRVLRFCHNMDPFFCPFGESFWHGSGYLVQMNLSEVGYLTGTQSVRTQGALELRSLLVHWNQQFLWIRLLREKCV